MPIRKYLRNLYAGFESDYTGWQPYAFTGFDTGTSTAGYLLLNACIRNRRDEQGKAVFQHSPGCL